MTDPGNGERSAVGSLGTQTTTWVAQEARSSIPLLTG